MGRPWRPPLEVRFAWMIEVLRWRAAAMSEGLGVGSKPWKGILSGTGKPTNVFCFGYIVREPSLKGVGNNNTIRLGHSL